MEFGIIQDDDPNVGVAEDRQRRERPLTHTHERKPTMSEVTIKKVDGITRESTQDMIDRTLEVYPEKAKGKRAPHLAPNDPTATSACVKSNRKTVPGVMSARGCAYAGAKGVVWGPIRDMVHVSHGPVGCGWYSWGTRRNLMSGINGVSNFAMQMTSDFQEKDIVYGGRQEAGRAAQGGQRSVPAGEGDFGTVRMSGWTDR